MLDLIYYLTAIQIFCKDIHYAFYGVNFKPLHEWADEIADPLYAWVDEIKENCLIAKGKQVPRGIDINTRASDYVPTALGENEQMLASLQAILTMAHNHISKMEEQDRGVEDLLGRIDVHLLKHIGFINMAIINQKKEQ